jgi:hypothetical protein
MCFNVRYFSSSRTLSVSTTDFTDILYHFRAQEIGQKSEEQLQKPIMNLKILNFIIYENTHF